MFTRSTDLPERRVWINLHPMRNGVVRVEVVMGSTKLHEFTAVEAAEKYRWWIIRREYKRLAAYREIERRDAASA